MTDREAFEAWVIENRPIHHDLRKNKQGTYLYSIEHHSWKVWQAACQWQRESDAGICAEFSQDSYARYRASRSGYDDGQCDAANELHDKIRSAA